MSRPIPTLPALSRDQCREVDRRAIEELGMSGLVLMENAGRGCVDVLCGEGIRGPVVIVCGRGNNGGDGFVIARHLEIRGEERAPVGPHRRPLGGCPRERRDPPAHRGTDR